MPGRRPSSGWTPTIVASRGRRRIGGVVREELHRSLREYVAGPATRLLSQFGIHDIETTVRTLQAITERAAGESSPAE
jgi:hypothetical protein